MNATTTKTIRVQLDLPEKRIAEIEELRSQMELPTRKDVFEAALCLLTWAAKQRGLGRIIASVDESTGDYREVLMPGLASIPYEKNKENGKEKLGTGLAPVTEMD